MIEEIIIFFQIVFIDLVLDLVGFHYLVVTFPNLPIRSNASTTSGLINAKSRYFIGLSNVSFILVKVSSSSPERLLIGNEYPPDLNIYWNNLFY